MNQELAIANKQAAELSEKAAVLSKKLTSLVTEVQFQHTSTVDPFIFAITIFSLACFVGYYVVWKVTPALHTPLMSITNAISGIIIIGALIASSSQGFSLSMVLGFLAAFLASINIFGGFIVTERMLEMFKKK
ncbi:MAG: NAD(P) transhydrogenase subunit alpha [Rickettsiaceae bacterium]|jgi:NAD(P) transhydrogenase subunit alpha|uniref:NAD(P) transhydrogenase subunit alpha n=1 Tax=Candidatus Megaera polyxenophila TaxID=988779 RepID=UPI001B6BE868|nr:NAD(P) transhydrogenase subunit alpha [Candidatus Megaera polyxenophila]MBP9777819.1 NAD(P) transhydrogenase subunit alpha [Rickettsiaceae bacterium]MCC8460793.1 NAD(P) transhydrogenase subunit alpha [Candidatus Megaera polyxenophila]WHA07293.1 NAD(P) transhydrogenase subunit alpha [Candidatus Megaera polyxenophila]BBB56770.1 NAD(P) transhydrogenase subunit alpha [Candidatus Megaera polyxenophila]